MSDNFGSQQHRVVSPLERNWDLPVFLSNVPFLTSELNLIGQIASLKAQEGLTSVVPSGWIKVEDILDIGNLSPSGLTDREDFALSGQVLTSQAYSSNSFKFISKNSSNIALVNGWKIVVQGSNTATIDDSNNLITLPEISSHRMDFVFLEVWKELVAYTDIVYPNGNVLAQAVSSPVSQAEIYYSTIGVETSKRVQIKYRIRSRMSSSNPGISLGSNSDGFGPGVSPIGGRGPDNYNDAYEFVNQAPLDPGLWVSQPISGPGTRTQAEMESDLGTVDGLVYAIPMFAVYRREAGTFNYSDFHKTSVEKLSAKISDRPDDRLLDVVHKEDIVDLRHQVMFSGKNLDHLVKKTFRKIVSGEHTSIKGAGFGSDGSRIDLSGGSSLLKSDRIDIGDPADPIIGSPSADQAFKRRAYCNASVTHKVNIFKKSKAGPWTIENFTAELIPSTVPALVTSIDGIYSTTIDPSTGVGFNAAVTDISNNLGSSDFKTVTFSIGGSSNILSVPYLLDLYIEYTVQYQVGNNGFKDVPRDFLEVRKTGTTLPIATRDSIVPIRSVSDTVQDFVRYAGGDYTDNYQFGHELVLYRTVSGSSPFVAVSISSVDYYGYSISGVKSIQRKKNDGTYGTYQTFEVSRTGTTYTITSIGNVTEANTVADLKITLYTIGKFFELSKQGRGVVDTYEMMEVTAVEEPVGSGNYLIDTGVKPIIAVGTFAVTTGGFIQGTAFAYNGAGTRISLNNPFSPTTGDNINSNLPIITSSGYQPQVGLPTKVKITSGSLSPSDTIKVPVLVHSYVSVGEGYAFFYKVNPYQGNITEEITGKMEAEGPTAITSEGSGGITLLTYSTGTAFFTSGSRVVTGTGTEWLSYVSANDYIALPTSPYLAYRIASIESDTSLTLTEPWAASTSVSTGAYQAFKLDVSSSGFTNVIDRMPSLTLGDYLGLSSQLTYQGTLSSYLDTSPIKKVQDPLEAIPGDFSVGVQGTAARGRNGVVLTNGENTLYKIGMFAPGIEYLNTSSSSTYKKVFQSYILNKDNTGRLYLMIISGETNNLSTSTLLNSYSLKDTVDIFEIIGRPLSK